MVMTNKIKFNIKYKQKRNQANGKDDISRLTGIPMRILDAVYDRGVGAYKTNRASVRPSVKSPEQWAMGRVYSFAMKQPGTWGKADADLAAKVKKIKPVKSSLTDAQKNRLKKHSVHHTKKHMDMMKRDMMNGMSFKMAHEKAMKSIGK